MWIFRTDESLLRYINYCYEIFRNMDGYERDILDVGAGFGLMSVIFAMLGAKQVCALDIDTQKLDVLSHLCDILDSQSVSKERASAVKIPHPNSTFDAVSAIEFVSHVGDLNAFVVEVHRILKPSGTLYLQDTNNALSIPTRRTRSAIWERAEEGPPDAVFRTPFKELRRRLIQERFPELDRDQMLTLVKETRGMWGQEIAEAVDTFIRTGHVGTKPRFGCRDPISGMFVEFDFNPYHLSRFIEVRGFQVSMRPLPPYEVQHPLLHSMGKTMLQYVPHSLASLFYYVFPKFEIVAERNETIKPLMKTK